MNQHSSVYAAPSFASNKVYELPAGVTLSLACWTIDGSHNLWLQLSDGNYIPLSYVTGTAVSAAPRC